MAWGDQRRQGQAKAKKLITPPSTRPNTGGNFGPFQSGPTPFNSLLNQIKVSNSPGNFRSKLNSYTPEQKRLALIYINAKTTLNNRRRSATASRSNTTKLGNYLNFNSILKSSIYKNYPELARLKNKLNSVNKGTLTTGNAQASILNTGIKPGVFSQMRGPWFNSWPKWVDIKNDPRLSAKQKETVKKIIASIKANIRYDGKRPAINFNINQLNNRNIKNKLKIKVRTLERAKENERRAREEEAEERRKANERHGRAPAPKEPEREAPKINTRAFNW